MKPLVLVGGGGHCESVIDVAENAGYEILGVLDRPELREKPILSYRVIGNDDDIPKYVDVAQFVVTVGQIKNGDLRHRLVQKVLDAGGTLATVVSSDATVSRYATLGAGTVVMHKAFINAAAQVGSNCIINTMANVEHDARIGDFCHVSTGAMINGGCVIGRDCFIGSQAVIVQDVKICAGAIVGAGAIVDKDITEPGVYVGNPAVMIEELP